MLSESDVRKYQKFNVNLGENACSQVLDGGFAGSNVTVLLTHPHSSAGNIHDLASSCSRWRRYAVHVRELHHGLLRDLLSRRRRRSCSQQPRLPETAATAVNSLGGLHFYIFTFRFLIFYFANILTPPV